MITSSDALGTTSIFQVPGFVLLCAGFLCFRAMLMPKTLPPALQIAIGCPICPCINYLIVAGAKSSVFSCRNSLLTSCQLKICTSLDDQFSISLSYDHVCITKASKLRSGFWSDVKCCRVQSSTTCTTVVTMYSSRSSLRWQVSIKLPKACVPDSLTQVFIDV